MKRALKTFAFCTLATAMSACGGNNDEPRDGDTPDVPGSVSGLPAANVTRAMELTDAAVKNYFTGQGMSMSRYYNPYS